MIYHNTFISFITAFIICILCIYFNNSATLTLATDSIGIPRRFVDNYRSCVNNAIQVINDVSVNLFKKHQLVHNTSGDQCDEDTDSITTKWGVLSSIRDGDYSAVPLWGSFRPGLYFGMKRRGLKYREASLATGIMWCKDTLYSRNFRHLTSQDELKKFEWIKHDGRSFGTQQLVDEANDMQILTTFLVPQFEETNKAEAHHQPVWIQRISVDISPPTVTDKSSRALLFYFGNSDMYLENNLNNLFPGSISDLRVSVNNNQTSSQFTVTATCFSLSLQRTLTLILTARCSDCTVSYLGTGPADVTSGTDMLSEASRHKSLGQQQGILTNKGDLSDSMAVNSTFLAIQIQFPVSSSLDIDVFFFETDIESTTVTMTEESLSEAQRDVTNIISFASKTFDNKFLRIFPDIVSSSFAVGEVEAAKRAVSAVLGGIGHFHGVPTVAAATGKKKTTTTTTTTSEKDEIFQSWKNNKEKHFVSLLTATPSRTSFPRGFLWDEGFHQLLISEWDLGLCMHIISDWLAAMQFPYDNFKDGETTTTGGGGWIPREMILGEEANRRVPDEFIPQRTNIANPPTLLLVVEKLMNKLIEQQQQQSQQQQSQLLLSFLRDLYPRLHQWLQWFLTSQSGSDSFPNSFRWRGRSLTDQKVVANTLASGLDDYPRAQIPSEEERHVDLHSWMVRSCDIMGKLQKLLHLDNDNNNSDDFDYESLSVALQSRLEDLHWSDLTLSYCDFGLNNETSYFHTELFFRCSNPSDKSFVDVAVPVEVYKSGSPFCPASHPQMLFPHGDETGNYKMKTTFIQAASFSLEYVPRFGYVSIFPLLLKVIDPLSPRLTDMMNIIESPNGLWTDFGLRSIAKVDKFYRRSNAPGDAPYWRGPIWININYLALASLHHYKQDPKTRSNYNELSKQEVKTVEKQVIRADALYHKLRNNLIKNVLGEYLKTGFFWEQYDDETGKGIRGHPFTGWTTLIVNIMAEKY